MGLGARKILTDHGTFYVAYESVVDQFVTPAFASLIDFGHYTFKEFSRYFTKSSPGYWAIAARTSKFVYDMRSKTVKRCLSYIEQLKQGITLTDEQAIELYEFTQFLDATVADHQYTHPGMEDETCEKWIDEFGIRGNYNPDWTWEDSIWESICSRVYYNAWSKKHYDFCQDESTGQASREENIIAGRYLSAMCSVAGLDGIRPPEAIVLKFLNFKNKGFMTEVRKVVDHGKRQTRRGRNPSMPFMGERNPRKALALAMGQL